MIELSNILEQFPYARHLHLLSAEVSRLGLSAFMSEVRAHGEGDDNDTSHMDIEIMDQSQKLVLAFELSVGSYEPQYSDYCSEELFNAWSDHAELGSRLLLSLFAPPWEPALMDQEWVNSILMRLLLDGSIPAIHLSWQAKMFRGFHRKPVFYWFSPPADYPGKPMRRSQQDRKAVLAGKGGTDFIALNGFQMHFGEGNSGPWINLETGSGFGDDNGDLWVCRGSSSTGAIAVRFLGSQLQFDSPALGYLEDGATKNRGVFDYLSRLFLPEHSPVSEVVFKCSAGSNVEVKVVCDGKSIDWDKIWMAANEAASGSKV